MSRLSSNAPDDKIYKEKVLELFNAASPENDLKWPVWLGEWEGNYSHEKALAGLHWLQDHDFHLRGHVLVWPGWKNLPQPIHKLHEQGRDDEIQGVIRDHINEMAQATKGLLSEWDVLNEPYTNHDLMDIMGKQVMVEWFQMAREAMPDTVLYLNDFSNHDRTMDAAHVAHFKEVVRYLQAHDAPLDGLGLQAHISGQPNDPVNVLATLDDYAKFGLPMRITEFDVRTEDEQLQADYTRDFLILMFSHPSVVGVQFWGFWAGSHWIPEAAMFRQDWTPKPAAGVYRDLVLNKWRTNADGTTDSQGDFDLRAFHGDYEITAELDGQKSTVKVSVGPDSAARAEINL